jgi:hypothetical protein
MSWDVVAAFDPSWAGASDVPDDWQPPSFGTGRASRTSSDRQAWITARMFPAGSLNQAIGAPNSR